MVIQHLKIKPAIVRCINASKPRYLDGKINDRKFKNFAMAYIVTEPCINCKYTNCAAVCPVDAFREGPNFLTIDPWECIDCDACVPECPVEAIYPDDEVPAEWENYIELNERLAEEWQEHIINETLDELPDADEWAEIKEKREHLKIEWD